MLSLRMSSALLVATALFSVGLYPRVAAAAGVSVGLLGIDGASVEPGMGQVLTEALSKHIPQLQGMRVEKSQQDLVEVKLVFGCTDENPSCMAKVGKSLGVHRLIYGSIRKQTQGTLYIVAIKQLNVADSTVEKFITEAVAPDVLRAENPQLNELVQRWLRVLLIEGLRGGLRVVSEPMGASVRLDGIPVGVTPLNLPEVDVGDHFVNIDMPGFVSLSRSIRIRGGLVHEVTAALAQLGGGSAPRAGRFDWNKALKITSYVAAGLAGVSLIAAIGTWRGYIGAEDGASASLDVLQRRLESKGTAGQYTGFFGSAEQLSSCGQVAGLSSDMDYQAYLGHCQRGNTLARATTGMWVMAGGFAAISVTAAVLATLRQPKKEVVQPAGTITDTQTQPSEGSAPTGGPPSSAPTAAPAGPQTAQMKNAKSSLSLIGLSPMLGPDGAALSAAFTF
jgi:hypothetical protein